MSALLAVEEAGRGEPLVLIHGLATTRQIWSPVTPALSRSRRVVILDVPGFGESAPIGPGFELEAVADRIARGLAARRVRAPFDLVGHSLGGGIALTLAATRPRLVRRLVLVAPAGLAAPSPRTTRLLSAGVNRLLAVRRSLAPLTDLAWGRRLLLAFAAADGARCLGGAARKASRRRNIFVRRALYHAVSRHFLVAMRSEPTARCDSVRLADGRRLNYSESGPRGGLPVFYCHGAIGTPLGRSVDLEAIAAEIGVRYLAVSRPGIGGSDPAPGRTVIDFAADLRELADALELDRSAVVGVSAGGPYALAVGRELGERVIRVGVCSSLSPLCAPHRTPGMQPRIRLALTALARAPGLCSAVGDAMLPVIDRHPELLSRVIAAHAAPGERDRLQQPDERSAASTSLLDAAAGGVRGMVEDYLTYSRDWGFSACDVEAEVHLWHGLCDPLVPIEHALQRAIALPRCRVFFDPDEGHHFFRRRLVDILTVLIGHHADLGAGLATSLDDARTLAAGRPGEPRRSVRRRRPGSGSDSSKRRAPR